jgi:hypothetical protein
VNKIKRTYAFIRLLIKYRSFSDAWKYSKIGKKSPCKFDHNFECLICDAWLSDCAYHRYLKMDYRFESREELEKLFKNYE